MRKLISIIISIAFIISFVNKISDSELLSFFTVQDNFLLEYGTDKEKIEFTINKFEECYNNGNFDDLTKCCTERAGSSLKSQMGIVSRLFGGLIQKFFSFAIGDDIGKNLWSLGTEKSQLHFKIKNINFLSSNCVEVSVEIIDNIKTESGYFQLEKEGSIWYIADLYQYSKA